MGYSKRLKLSLFGMLISLNCALRYPTVPHQIGKDGYFHHYMTNDVLINGYHTSWLHPLSAFGLYPASYASGTETVLAGIAMLSGMNVEETVLLYSFLMGIMMALFSYMLGTKLFRKDSSAFIFSFIFSTSMLMLYASTWTISVRGTFIMLLPLFLWSLLRYRDSEDFNDKLTSFLLTTFLFVFLVSLHHLYTFLLPLLFAFFLSNRLYGMKNEFFIRARWVFPMLFTIFAAGWLFFILVEINPTVAALFRGGFIKDLGQRIMYSTVLYGRSVGFITLVGIPGILLTFIHSRKSNDHLLLLFTLIFITPFFLIASYMGFFLLLFMCWLCVLAIEYLRCEWRNSAVRKTLATGAALMVLFSTSVFFHSTSYGVAEQYSGKTQFTNEPYVEEITFDSAMWAKEELNGSFVTSHGNLFFMRISAYSENYHFNVWDAMMATQDFSEFDNMKVEFESPLSIRFWKAAHFKTDAIDQVLHAARTVYRYNVTESRFAIMQFKYDFSYVIEDTHVNTMIPEDELKFSQSVHYSRFCIYKNARGSFWLL